MRMGEEHPVCDQVIEDLSGEIRKLMEKSVKEYLGRVNMK